MALKVEVVILGAVLALASPGAAAAQATVERHFGLGAANLIAPMVTGGVDIVGPQGVGLGGGALLVVVPGWALAGATARAGYYARGSGAQPFVALELAALAESDCCGGSAGYAVSVGATRWRGRDSAFRFEGRLFVPFQGEGALIMVQFGKTFRSRWA